MKSKHLIQFSIADNDIVKQWNYLIKNCLLYCSVPPQVICSPCFRTTCSLSASAEKTYFHTAGKVLEYLFTVCVNLVLWGWFVSSGLKLCVCQHCSSLSSWPFQMKESSLFTEYKSGELLELLLGSFLSLGQTASAGVKHLLCASVLGGKWQKGILLRATNPNPIFPFFWGVKWGRIIESWVCLPQRRACQHEAWRMR